MTKFSTIFPIELHMNLGCSVDAYWFTEIFCNMFLLNRLWCHSPNHIAMGSCVSKNKFCISNWPNGNWFTQDFWLWSDSASHKATKFSTITILIIIVKSIQTCVECFIFCDQAQQKQLCYCNIFFFQIVCSILSEWW